MLRYKKNNNSKTLKTLQTCLGATCIQNYVPLYKRFFSLNDTNWNSINLDHEPIHDISTKDDVIYCGDMPLFFKFSPLLDPLRYLTGSYETYDFTLPTLTTSPHSKLSDENNSSYIDSFFSYLSSHMLHTQDFIHGTNFYGSYLGIKTDFSYNIEDDVDTLQDSDKFHENNSKLFHLNREYSFLGSRKNKSPLIVSDELAVIAFDSLDDDDDTSSSGYSDNGLNLHAIIHKFPVQIIALERYTDTLDSILDDLEATELTAALMQVIMTLLVYQKVYQFTHNDLHTNNIMFTETTDEFIYYRFNDTQYKVPTFGKLFKIIDFGRSIYTFQNKIFVSDSFHVDGDAASQYNIEPYFDKAEPYLPPNYSFDLCRLACSLSEGATTDDEIYVVIEDWCNDDKGDNILYTPEGIERYPEFELYRMIAQTVHNHTPEAQLKRSLFQSYKVDDVSTPFVNIDSFTRK